VTTFADSSALVKLYADEPGHEQIRKLHAIAVAQIVRVEIPAALWRKQRMGEFAVEDVRVLTADFEADYFGELDQAPRFASIAVTSGVLDQAANLCATRGLRAYDAVQLSSALAARRADRDCTSFAVFDVSLRAAGAAEGFDLIPDRI
jgi:uncharacterized protein